MKTINNRPVNKLFPFQMTNKKLQYLWLFIVIIWCAFALRLWHIDTESIWHDEGWSIRAIRGPFTTPDDNTPYAYYFTGHLLWKLGAGESALALRYVSVLIGVLTVAMVMRIGRLWVGIIPALAAGLLVASSPLLWDYSQEVRGYVGVPLVDLLLLGGADAILRYDRGAVIPRRVWAFVFLAELWGIYTHNLAVPLVIWLNGAVGVVWLLRRDWRHIITWSGLQCAVIVAYIPWLLTQSPSGTLLNSPPQIGLPLVRDIWLSYFLPILSQLQNHVLTPYLVVYGLLMGGVIVFRLVWLPQGGPFNYRWWLLSSHVVGVPVLSTALILVAHIDFHPRYYIAAVPVTLLCMVLAVTGVTRLRQMALIPAVGVVLAVLPALIFSAVSLHQMTTTRGYQHDDFQGLAAYYASLPEETAILIPFNVERALQDYYADALPIKAEFINVPLYADDATAIETINGLLHRPLEFLTWFQLPADVRGMYPCLLSAASTQVDAPQTYYGLQTQRFIINTPIEWQAIPVSPTYQSLELLSAAYAGDCVRLEWRLKQTTDEPIRAAVSVLNPFGEPMSRQDVDISNPENVTTDNWIAGDIGQSYHVLPVAANAPLMAYDLDLTVYSESMSFDLLDEAGNPAGKAYVVEGAFVAEGAAQNVYQQSAVVGSNVQDVVESGQNLDVELILVNEAADSQIEVVLSGEGWTLEQPGYGSPSGVRAWHRFVVPSGYSGEALLTVDDVVLNRYQVVDVPHIFDAPAYEHAVGAVFPDVGTLVGVTVDTGLSAGSAPQVTLIWRADEPPQTDVAYTVFVQLLSADGRVVAQSDQQPHRPTNGWIEGEYITDEHTLHMNMVDYRGPVTLVAGFYDANNNFQRVMTANGDDYTAIDLKIIIDG